MKYFLYARKSSESEDRQVQSIDDQIKYLQELAVSKGIHIIEILQESMSAKQPGRPVFNEMLNRIHKGEAQGVICWKLDRLARNPIDGGNISWILQQNILKHIVTHSRDYYPTDNVLMMSVELGMANQFIQDLSVNVKRGIKSKLEKGILPCFAPNGYMNDKDNKTIISDPERFHLVRKMWDMMLTGNYTVPEILNIANDTWGYRTKKTKKSGGKPLARSTLYKILTNIFYTGIIEWNGEIIDTRGKPQAHHPMVTLEEFDRVQELLGRDGKPRNTKNHEFAYTGIIKCGDCGCMITAQEKTKYIKKTGETKKYTYYHCTKRKQNYKCSQVKNIRVEDLENQINEELAQLTILPEFKDWALEVLKEQNEVEVQDKSEIQNSLHRAIEQTEGQLDRLTDLLLKELIDEQEFKKKKTLLQKDLSKFQQQRDQTENRSKHWRELTEKTFNFVTYSQYHFQHGDLKVKKEILLALGQNFLLKDGKLTIELNEWLKPIYQEYKSIESEYLKLELLDNRIETAKKDPCGSVSLRWLGVLDSNQR